MNGPRTRTACVYFPVVRRLPAGSSSALGDAPLALAERLAHRPGFFWLDSSAARAGADAWSFLGVEPAAAITYRQRRAEIHAAGRLAVLDGPRALTVLARELFEHRAAPVESAGRQPPFTGGWFALCGYDLGRQLERLPQRAADDLPFPDLYLARHETLLAFDHKEGQWWAACLVPADVPSARRARHAEEQAHALLETMHAQARATNGVGGHGGPPHQGTPHQDSSHQITSNFTRVQYETMVARALEYIAAGDIYQVNLSQRFECAWRASAFELYRRLRTESPSRYGAFANLGAGRAVASISPELFLSMRGREVLTRPIKGTRPRGVTPDQDAALAAELDASAKERAELTMIVDLERNDLGRVCDYGSVKVASAGALEFHPTVIHRVAAVAGHLHHRRGVRELLCAMFPGGSVTGAPKVRAMQIIEELEPHRRGPYCGAIGWIGADGDVALNLAIRTALIDERAGKAWYQAGGGIVADSDPAREYEETLAKAAAFFRAVNGRLI